MPGSGENADPAGRKAAFNALARPFHSPQDASRNHRGNPIATNHPFFKGHPVTLG